MGPRTHAPASTVNVYFVIKTPASKRRDFFNYVSNRQLIGSDNMNSAPITDAANPELKIRIINHTGYKEVTSIGGLKHHFASSNPPVTIVCTCIGALCDEQTLTSICELSRWEA